MNRVRQGLGAGAFALVALTPLVGWLSGHSHRIQATDTPLIVQADKVIGPINPFVYGANDGPWAFIPLDMQPQSQVSGIKYLRFPAGNWGDQNDVTPLEIDMFIASAKVRHAEPTISVRLKDGTPTIAAEMVRYTNIEQKYGVHYWSVGNEPDLYPNYTVEQYVKDWRASALAMKAVDPTIVFVGPDISQYPPTVDAYGAKYRDWLKAFLKADGDMVSIVSVHRYGFPLGQNAPPTTIEQLRRNAHEWDVIIPDLRNLIKTALGHDLPVGITELNSHWSKPAGGPADPDSFYHAVWWADVLGRLIRQRVDVVAYWTLYTGSSDAAGLIGHDDVRPTYYVYQLYQQFGNTLLTSGSTDPDVTITAASRSDGTLTLMVVNPTDQAKTLPISISGITAGDVTLWRLDSTHNAEKIGSSNEIGAGSLNLPAQSVSLYIVAGK